MKYASMKVKGETAKCLAYLAIKWGLKNSDVLKNVFIHYCEDNGIFAAVEGKKFRRG